MSIGQNIKRLRELHGMNQSELAQIAGVTDKAVSTWENDLKIPRMGAIQKIADYFHISKSAIIEDESQNPLPIYPFPASSPSVVTDLSRSSETQLAANPSTSRATERISLMRGQKSPVTSL